MVAEIRCDKCGELVGTNHAHDRNLRCANCNNRIEISSAVSMPFLPKLSTNENRPGKVEIHEDTYRESILSQAMPWVLSLFFHVGLGVIMLFFALVWHNSQPTSSADIVTAKLDTNPPLSANFEKKKPEEQTTKKSSARPRDPRNTPKARGEDKPDSKIPHDISLKTWKIPRLKGNKGGGFLDQPDGVGKKDGDGDGDDDDDGYARANNVVYVIDRSGSMVDTFDILRQELRLSISLLDTEQHFHVIMFTEGKPMESIARRLLSATDDSKLQAGAWLESVRPAGQTNPSQALERAFKVLQGAKGTKLIYFLTDGVFQDNKAVLSLLTRLNADKSVHINTFLYGDQPSAVAEEVMKQIASDHGGRYDYVNPSE